jgi:outer membrane protein OmpA-like peptidoglycan-associated protein
LTAEYRFYGVLDAPSFHGSQVPVYGVAPVGNKTGNVNINSDYNHSLLVGVRYAFNTAPPAAAATAAPSAPPPAVTAARTYLVFFDWDRSDLSDRARQIVAEAAQASTRVQTTRIEVQGNADKSGTPAYNQRLSLRRAQTVAAELVRDGVARTAIDIQAFGDTKPLVQTAPGVREPQNRRVAIILR